MNRKNHSAPKEAIPVYDLCSLSESKDPRQELLAERFGAYLKRHTEHLHRPHRHSFYHLVLFTRGRGSHTIDFERFAVQPGQVYFMVPGQVHSWHFEGEVDGYIIHFSDQLFRSFLQDPYYLERFPFFSGNSAEGVCQLPEDGLRQVFPLMETILGEAAGSDPFSLDRVRLALLDFFIAVDRRCGSAGRKSVPPQKATLLRSFQKLVDRNFRLLRLPKEYAALLYVTPNHLNALCQDLLGKTAGEVIRDRVLLEARRLLTNAGQTVTEIAYDLNFQDNSYFNRFFKKETGQTPEEFRKQFIHA
ncbi:AraC family transcriptional regulator [Paraflavisolibacter sp. H34]|uniref:AraC family transcriptional regulator n=1 Tax=Huijunlia imazamoxiresistens TaxID=3127457 RepID=UPI00301614F4